MSWTKREQQRLNVLRSRCLESCFLPAEHRKQEEQKDEACRDYTSQDERVWYVETEGVCRVAIYIFQTGYGTDNQADRCEDVELVSSEVHFGDFHEVVICEETFSAGKDAESKQESSAM